MLHSVYVCAAIGRTNGWISGLKFSKILSLIRMDCCECPLCSGRFQPSGSDWISYLGGSKSNLLGFDELVRPGASLLRLGSSSQISSILCSSLRLSSSSYLLGPFSSQVFSSGLTRMPFSIQLIPYIPWEMANCFPRAELSHKHHFRFTPEVMTSFPVTLEVRSWTGSGTALLVAIPEVIWYHSKIMQ